ncbi:MAG: tRNA (guanosine(46)-N7)-methyltransferase TrmB [Planctomycetaceae bacterium]
MPRPPALDLKPYFVTLDDLDGIVDWGRFFGNDNPVEIDVGSGRGLFLVTAGAAHPNINYVGVELDYKEGRRAARRIKKREMPNVRVVGGDVRVFFDEHVRPSSVAAVHVYFPDPWWKRRHRRRRVFTDQLVSQMAAALKPGGLVHSWTDVEEYFVVISALMNHDQRFEPLPTPPVQNAEHDLDYRTSFERKKRQAGRTIHRGMWRLKSST